MWKAQTRLNEFLRTLKCFVGKQITIFFFISAYPKSRMRTIRPDKRGPTLSEPGSFSFDSQRWPKKIKVLRMRMAWTVLIFETCFYHCSVFFSRPVLGMLLGALIWIATLVPYFVVYNDRKYKAMTRYQEHVYLTGIIIHSKYFPNSDWLKAHA